MRKTSPSLPFLRVTPSSNCPFARILGGLTLVLSLALGSASAKAEDDLLASMFTPDGFELRRDDRLITLFAAFNAAGFDRAVQERELPFPRKSYHPLRLSIRRAMPRQDSAAVQKIEAFLEEHPLPLQQYVEAVFALSDAPEFSEGKHFPAELKGLGALLAGFYKEAGLARMEKSLVSAYRDEMRALRDQVNDPFAKLRAAFLLNELDAPVLMIVPNPLDASGAALAFASKAGFHVLVLGSPLPGQKLDLEPALTAYADLLAQEAVSDADLSSLAASVKSLEDLDKGSHLSATELAAGSLRRAVMAKMAGDATRLKEAQSQGFFLATAFYERLESLVLAPAAADSESGVDDGAGLDDLDDLDVFAEPEWLLKTQVVKQVLEPSALQKQMKAVAGAKL